MTTWIQVSRRMDHLIASDAPAFLKAHWLMNVGLPVLMRSIGVKECSAELVHMMTSYLCDKSGLCPICKKADSVSVTTQMCVGCVAQMDQIAAEVMQDEEENPLEE